MPTPPRPAPTALTRTVPFDAAAHTTDLVDALVSVRAAGGLYPPPQDTGGDRAALAAWFAESASTHQWAATTDGRAVGHAMLTPAHTYLTDHLARAGHPAPAQVLEVCRLFVDPAHRHHHHAWDLLTHACQAARDTGHQPALAVLDTFAAARALYERFGFVSTGTFAGLHGLNHVLVLP